MTGRVGFACKYMYEDQNLKPKQLKEVQQPLTFEGGGGGGGGGGPLSNGYVKINHYHKKKFTN